MHNDTRTNTLEYATPVRPGKTPVGTRFLYCIAFALLAFGFAQGLHDYFLDGMIAAIGGISLGLALTARKEQL